jgi:N-acetylglucosaminyldiphosphoundecaprenol N-acetyl-beta-D-mannosaminyltransferase
MNTLTSAVVRAPVDILGTPFHPYSFDEVVELIRDAVTNGGRLQIVPGNVDFVMKARRDADFRDVLTDADVVVPDGVPIVWAASALGTPLKGRVSGTELVVSVAGVSAELGVPVGLVGAAPGVGARAARVMGDLHPGAQLIAIETPSALDERGTAGVLDRLEHHGCGIVLAALGAPRQERFSATALAVPTVRVAIGVGSAFDIISGDKPRAPQWMCDHGLEWLHRMAQDPGRLGRRYLFEDSPFLFHLAKRVVRQYVDRIRS